MNIRLLVSIAAVVALASALAACGGGSDDSSATATPGVMATEEPGGEAPGQELAGVQLTWWGHAMFLLEASDGTRVLIDPYSEIGYRLPDASELRADVVTASHEHGDHSNVDLGGDATLLRGLTADGWADVDEQVSDELRITSAGVFHDASDGAERGRTTFFVFETGGLRIAHAGDLGHTLTQEQIDAIGPVDVLLIPVGGVFTIDAAGATEVAAQLAPRVTIPMHYGTDSLAFELDPVDAFLEGKDATQLGSSTVLLDVEALPDQGEGVVWVLDPAGAE